MRIGIRDVGNVAAMLLKPIGQRELPEKPLARSGRERRTRWGRRRWPGPGPPRPARGASTVRTGSAPGLGGPAGYPGRPSTHGLQFVGAAEAFGDDDEGVGREAASAAQFGEFVGGDAEVGQDRLVA